MPAGGAGGLGGGDAVSVSVAHRLPFVGTDSSILPHAHVCNCRVMKKWGAAGNYPS
ncbi:hypothetical protein RHRU231_600004 [Rhodococcus ruber]|uniref:Uncharacterized protein n=1 Tax=Rhodococcus ruber TaxID=1830 RepID=A0A098BQR8_9NOCA|nr:hypothetical protein RHRU231_600004 [Rhodococcus ruber]